MRKAVVSLLVGVALAPSLASGSQAIDWGKAGQFTAPAVPELPQEKKRVDTSGFDCRTRTKFSVEDGGLDRDGRPLGPTTVQTCTREGLSIEIGPTD
ncbi:hypothetical protein [Rhizobium sp. RU36D]|uniref:hypothetical protein n=1 Tax=Rhizobium sp. RU36D TaxID=1907415 RepID=UPI0009D89CD8|nr:hypothetical protein [Rhizobium sp. RU36D]SMC68629.1 hypothetical protein SAMN05880593_104289 [Rhizobium sp. RU36D]